MYINLSNVLFYVNVIIFTIFDRNFMKNKYSIVINTWRKSPVNIV